MFCSVRSGACFGIVYELIGIEPIVISDGNPQPGGRRGRGGRGGVSATEAEAEAERIQRIENANKALTAIFEKQPNWIFVIDRNAAFKERENANELLAANPVISQSTAWNHQRVVHLSGVDWYLIGGGVTPLKLVIDQVSQAFDRQASQ